MSFDNWSREMKECALAFINKIEVGKNKRNLNVDGEKSLLMDESLFKKLNANEQEIIKIYVLGQDDLSLNKQKKELRRML